MPRIQKVLASAGVASRRNVERMIREGRVTLNGKVVTELPILVDPEVDRVQVDGEPVAISSGRGGPRLYILLNKPKHVYSTNVAQGEQTLAIDLLPPNLPGRVFPVGRLDAESKGLLLLTNDGEMTNRLTHPRYGVPKTYRAVVDGYIDPRRMQALSKSIWLSDGTSTAGPKTQIKTVHSHLKIVKRSRDMTVLDITIREGRSRQIRRILTRFGHKVRDLTRIAMGPLTLQGLSPGQFRHLTNREVGQLRALTQQKV